MELDHLPLNMDVVTCRLGGESAQQDNSMQHQWLLQSNIWNEYGYTRFIGSVANSSIDYEVVDVIPFTETFKQDVDCTPTQVFGSGRFVNICRAKGFPTFKSFNPIEPFYEASSWVNGDGHDIKWGEIPKADLDYPCFIKPYTEKFFTGMVFEAPEDHNKVQLATSFIDDECEEIVRVSRVHDILEEIRFYIIGGLIVSGSCYKVNRGPQAIPRGRFTSSVADMQRHHFNGSH